MWDDKIKEHDMKCVTHTPCKTHFSYASNASVVAVVVVVATAAR